MRPIDDDDDDLWLLTYGVLCLIDHLFYFFLAHYSWLACGYDRVLFSNF